MVRILVADDDHAILDSTQLLLECEGYEVITASSGDAVCDMENNLPDVILLDIWLSGTNGAEVARFLKAQERTRHIPIILFSANRHIEHLAKEAGVEDTLTKPFDIETLLQKIQKYTPFSIRGRD